MAIIVRSIDEEFKVVIESGEDKVEFYIKQLDYKTKSHITGLTTNVKQGKVSVDSALTCFYNVKYGLKRVKGLQNENGEEYKLEFEDNSKKCLSDACTDQLLATPFADNLIYVAMNLSAACYPSKVLHPLTNEEIEGVEVIPASQLKATSKK